MTRKIRLAVRSLLLVSVLLGPGCWARPEPDPLFASSLARGATVLADGLVDVFATFFGFWYDLLYQHPTEMRLLMERSCEMPPSCSLPEEDLSSEVPTTELGLPCLPKSETPVFNAELKEHYGRCVARCERDYKFCLDEALFLTHLTPEQRDRTVACEASLSECSFETDACKGMAAIEDEAVVEAMRACFAEPCDTRNVCFARVLIPEFQLPTAEQIETQRALRGDAGV